MHPDILPLHAQIEEDHWWFLARRRIVAEVLRSVLPPGEGHTVLDLGCGTGGNVGALGREYACTGLELDADAVRFAASHYPGGQFQQASVLDFESWPPLDPVDACLLMDVIEHLDDDRLAVANAVRILKPGGHLLITVPADPRLWSRHDEHHEHRRRYTPATLRNVPSGLPLEEVLVTGFNARLYWPIRTWRWFQLRLPQGLGSRGTTGDLHMPPAFLNRLLTGLMSGESARVLAALRGAAPPYRRGVSLLALFRRLPDG